jgi:hypothetical protein
VLIAVHQEVCALGTVKATYFDDLEGYMVQVSVQLPESKPLHVTGVYCPHIIPIRKRIHTMSKYYSVTPHPTMQLY